MLKNIFYGIIILISLFFLKITYNTEVYTREVIKEPIPQYSICYPLKEEQKVIKNIFDCPAQK